LAMPRMSLRSRGSKRKNHNGVDGAHFALNLIGVLASQACSSKRLKPVQVIFDSPRDVLGG
jgi:hypothetical protein